MAHCLLFKAQKRLHCQEIFLQKPQGSDDIFLLFLTSAF